MSITQERLKELLHYDPETGMFTWLVDKGRVKAGSVAGCDKGRGYIRIVVDRKRYYAHRLAWLYVYGETPKINIDHVNNITSDNSLVNLRPVTQAQNCQNRRAPNSGCAVGYLGVAPWKGRYRAQIMINMVAHHLGLYPTAEEAHVAYLEAKRKLHPYGML